MIRKINIADIFIIIIVFGIIIIGCGDDEEEAILNIQFELAPNANQQAEITRVVVIISGSDIKTQEIELEVNGRKASGVVAVPAGEERIIQVKAYAGDIVEFEGEAYVDHPEPGAEIPITIQLKPTQPFQQEEKIFEIGNIGGVDNFPTSPSVFTLSQSYFITQIITYHWNYGQGATPGTISLTDSNRNTYGPWQAVGSDGQGGVKNAYWTVKPNIELPSGTYTVIDSDPNTWAQNFESNGQGFVDVYGYPVGGGTSGNLESVIYGKDGMQMRLIPAGDFIMGFNQGEPEEGPEHTVYLDAFYIDIYEVTNSQYMEFVRATGHREPEGIGLDEETGFKPWQDQNYNGLKQPVVCVSYEDAQAYAKWAGKRLPTEAEWEKAARGGKDGQIYSWGNSWPPSPGSGNYADETFFRIFLGNWVSIEGYNDGYAYTSPAGSFKQNGYGLFDMDGNVAELCSDFYSSSYYSVSPRRNPTGPAAGSFRVIRGNGWFASDENGLRISYREEFDPPDPIVFAGFRCVKDAK